MADTIIRVLYVNGNTIRSGEAVAEIEEAVKC